VGGALNEEEKRISNIKHRLTNDEIVEKQNAKPFAILSANTVKRKLRGTKIVLKRFLPAVEMTTEANRQG